MNVKYLYIIICLVIIMPISAEAGISIIPDRHIVSLAPGGDAVVMYQVHNSGNEDINIVIEPKAWSGFKDPYEWLSLESENIYVKAGESTPFIVKLNVPEGAEGEMVAMLFLCYKEDSQSQLNIRNGIPLYMIVKGTENYGIDIEDVGISYGRKGDFYDLNFVVEIRNSGNTHIVPDIAIVVKNDEGKIIKTISLKRPNIVLRDKIHTYRLIWREPGLKNGVYSATAILDYEDKIAPKVESIRFQVTGSKIEKIDIANTGD